MFGRKLKLTILFMAAMVALVAILSCSSEGEATTKPLVYYSADQVDSARACVTEGYELLDSNLVDSAVAAFAMVDQYVPNGRMREYHTACAYGRTGNTEETIKWLQKLVDAGYTGHEDLEYDTDLESAKEDPRFAKIVAQAKANLEASGKFLEAGMPEYDAAPEKFADLEACEAWIAEQSGILRINRAAWTASEYTRAQMDLIAKKLACLREIKKDDPEFDYHLERVREAASILSMYEAWGAMADIVLAEVDKCLQNSSSETAKAESHYRAGLAQSMKYKSDNDARVGAYTAANKHLALVNETSEFYPAAKTLTMVNQLRLPNADVAALKADFQTLADEYSSDRNAYRIISTQYGPGAVDLLWPIPIGLEDIDGKMVNIDDYKGKVLLVDFWATWCGPCRAELPNVLATYEKYHDQGFEIVSISLDYEDRKPLPDYRDWIAENKMTWRHTYDGEGWNTPLVKKYFVSGIPATFLVGPDGSLIAKGDDLRGEKLGEQIQKALGAI